MRHDGTSRHWPFSAGSSLPAPSVSGAGTQPTLSRRRRNSRTSGVPMSGPRSGQEGHLARRQLHNRFATPLKLPGTDWGGAPPTRNGREREGQSMGYLYLFTFISDQ